MKRSNNYISFVDMLIYMLIFIASTLFVGTSTQHLLEVLMPDTTSEELSAINTSASYIFIFATTTILWLFYRKTKLSASSHPYNKVIRLGRFNLRYIAMGLVVIFASSIVIEPLYHLFPESMITYLDIFLKMPLGLALVSTVVSAPILEEIMFRGVLLNDASTKWGTRKSIIITSALFAILHINPIQILSAMISGVVLGVVYIKSDRGLLNVVCLHMINNLISLLILKNDSEAFLVKLQHLIGNDMLYYGVYSVSIFILGSFIYRSFRKKLD